MTARPLTLVLFGEGPCTAASVQRARVRWRTPPAFTAHAGAETTSRGLARLGLKVGWASRLGTDSICRALLAAAGAKASIVRTWCTMPAQRSVQERVMDGLRPAGGVPPQGLRQPIEPADVDEPWRCGRGATTTLRACLPPSPTPACRRPSARWR